MEKRTLIGVSAALALTAFTVAGSIHLSSPGAPPAPPSAPAMAAHASMTFDREAPEWRSLTTRHRHEHLRHCRAGARSGDEVRACLFRRLRPDAGDP